MKQKLLLLVVFFNLNLFAQKDFEKGFFIDEANNKTECLIKNYDWIGVPNEIEYKLSEGSNVETRNFSRMTSFQVYNTSHYYIKSEVSLDRNKEVKNYKPKTETIILQVLLEGAASLYTSSDIFFYQLNDGKVKQLLYKKYVDEDAKIKEDNLFRTELYESLKCENNIVEIRNLNYSKRDFMRFFKNYNICKSSESKTYTNASTKTKFNVAVIAGANFNNSTFQRQMSKATGPVNGVYQVSDITQTAKTGNELSFLFGFEAEMLLPFNKSKWALFIAPNYQKLNYEVTEDNVNIDFQYGFGVLNVKAEYSCLEVPIGIRHYFTLNENSKLFLDGAYNYIKVMKSEENQHFVARTGEEFSPSNAEDVKNATNTIRIGLGYKYNNKYSLSLNYHTKRELSNSEINTISVIASYKIF